MSSELKVVDARSERLLVLCFKLRLELCSQRPGEGWVSDRYQYVVTAASWEDAFKQAQAARDILLHNAKAIERPLKGAEPYLGSLYIESHFIAPLEAGRPLQTYRHPVLKAQSMLGVFEWKLDRGFALVDAFAGFLARRDHEKAKAE